MRATLIGSTALCLALLSGAVAAQGVYKWVDENGVTSFGETPPDGVQAVQTDVRFRRTDPAAVQARLDEERAVQDAVDTRERQEREQAAEQAELDVRNEEIRKQNCQLALDRQRKYDQAIRLYRPTEDGGRDYLTDAELDAERAEANRQVNEWCSQR